MILNDLNEEEKRERLFEETSGLVGSIFWLAQI